MSKASWCVFSNIPYAAVHISVCAAHGQRKSKSRNRRNFSSLALEDWVL